MRAHAVAALTLVASCRGPARAPEARPATDAGPAADAHAPRTPCEALMAEGARALSAWRRFAPSVTDAARWQAIGGLNHCEATEGGAWATVLDPPAGDATPTRPGGRFKLVFVSDGGTRSEGYPALVESGERFVLRANERNWTQDEITSTRMGAWSLADLDGDHVSEVLIPITERAEASGESAYALVWKASAARIEAFAPVMGLHPVGFQDVDNDGRPDVLTHADVTGSYNNAAGADVTLRGPQLVALTRSGGAVLTSSGQALTYNRTRCPAMPTSLIVAGDARGSARNVACAVLWRMPRAALLAALQRECPDAARRAPATCGEWMPALLAMADATPQVDLRAALVFAETELPRVGEDAGRTDAPLRHVVLRVEGLGVFTPTVDFGNVDGVCTMEAPDARQREVAHYKCWWAGLGDEFRVLRVGASLTVQRRTIGEESPPSPWREAGHVTVPPPVALRASDEH